MFAILLNAILILIAYLTVVIVFTAVFCYGFFCSAGHTLSYMWEIEKSQKDFDKDSEEAGIVEDLQEKLSSDAIEVLLFTTLSIMFIIHPWYMIIEPCRIYYYMWTESRKK